MLWLLPGPEAGGPPPPSSCVQAVQVGETPIGMGDRHSGLTAVVRRQDASTADLMRCANAGASLMAALTAKPTMSLPKPWPSKVLRIVTFV